jgi:cytidylate kinase
MVVGLTTLLLGALFVGFQGSGSSTYSLVLAAGWALGPVIAGVIVFRIQRKS